MVTIRAIPEQPCCRRGPNTYQIESIRASLECMCSLLDSIDPDVDTMSTRTMPSQCENESGVDTKATDCASNGN